MGLAYKPVAMVVVCSCPRLKRYVASLESVGGDASIHTRIKSDLALAWRADLLRFHSRFGYAELPKARQLAASLGYAFGLTKVC